MNNVKAEVLIEPRTFKPVLNIVVNYKLYTIDMEYLEYLDSIGEAAIDISIGKDRRENKILDEENNSLKARVGKLEKTLSRVKKHIKY